MLGYNLLHYKLYIMADRNSSSFWSFLFIFTSGQGFFLLFKTHENYVSSHPHRIFTEKNSVEFLLNQNDRLTSCSNRNSSTLWWFTFFMFHFILPHLFLIFHIISLFFLFIFVCEKKAPTKEIRFCFSTEKIIFKVSRLWQLHGQCKTEIQSWLEVPKGFLWCRRDREVHQVHGLDVPQFVDIHKRKSFPTVGHLDSWECQRWNLQG